MSPPRRIGLDARYVSDRYHGIGRYAFRLWERMVAQAPERTFVFFRGRSADTRFDWESLSSAPNVEIRSGPWPLFVPHEQLLWPVLLHQNRVELFHSPYVVAPLLARCPVLITIHDLIFERYPQYMPQRWMRPYYRTLTAASVRRASRVLTVSEATARDLMESPYYVPRAKLRVLPNAVEPGWPIERDEAREAQVRAQYGLRQPFVLVVGARRPHKNYGRLVAAFARVAPDVPHDLVFVGPPDERFADEARDEAHATGLSARVRFLDWVSEEALAVLYTLADAVAVPSLIEGFGLPALEAMAAGTPVLAANTPSLPEVAGDAGIKVDPYDIEAIAHGLGHLLKDAGLREYLAEKGRVRARCFCWKETARKTLQVYEELFE